METENILDPDANLIQRDEFYLFYEMMIQSLKTDNVKEGINRSLFLLRSFLKSGNITLYQKNTNGMYVFKMSDSKLSEVAKSVGYIINKTKPLVEKKGIFYLDLNLSESLHNVMMIHVGITDNCEDEYAIVVLNVDQKRKFEPKFWDRTKDTMQIILKRATSYEKNMCAVTTDLLTGLDNRNSYEMKKKLFNETDDSLILGVFDLFRLKFINDNYNHAKGDKYIKEVAKMLNKYWPKQEVVINDELIEENIMTGHCVYRIGGDEFVLLTTKENLQLSGIKSNLVRDEAELIDLGIDINVPIGINYGLVQHNSGDNLRQTFKRADEIMKKDKEKMYKKYNLERRN